MKLLTLCLVSLGFSLLAFATDAYFHFWLFTYLVGTIGGGVMAALMIDYYEAKK